MGNELSGLGGDSSGAGDNAFLASLTNGRAAKKGIVRDSSATLFDGHGLVGAHGTQKVRTVTKSVAHRKSLTATLRHCFLFESMTDGELNAVVDAFKKKGVPARETVVKQGEAGEHFFVVLEGQFRYSYDGVEVGEYKPGDFFGELSLLHGTLRDMSVIAVEDPCAVWVIDRASFRTALAVHHQSLRENMVQRFNAVPLLAKLKKAELMSLVDGVRRVKFSAGQRVFKKDDLLTTFYMVDSGKVREVPNGAEHIEGEFIGEMALLGGHAAESDVIAVNATVLLAIDIKAFESALGPYMRLLEAHYNCAVLAQVPSLAKLTAVELKRLNAVLAPERHQPLTTLVSKGEVLNKLVFLVGGTCVLEGPNAAGKDTRDPYVAMNEPFDPHRKVLEAGDFFGQMALLSEETVGYTVTAGPEAVDVLTLSRHDVTALLGPLHRLIIQREELEPQPNEVDEFDGDLRPLAEKQKWTLRDQPEVVFEELRAVALLRPGTFSDLRLVVHKPIGSVYGLKSYSRPQLKLFKAEALPMREKAALSVVGSHPFISTLINTYKNPKKLYMLVEYVPGGSLYHRLHKPAMSGASSAGESGTHPLPEASAQFYAASVCLALGFMHSRGVVWRNCCPENILLDAEGFIRLVDFETAKAVPSGEHTHTLCGCASYLAPEMLLGKGHREGVDWWALGVLIFEMLTGHTPFEDLPLKRNDVVMRNIVRGAYVLPNDLPEYSPDLLERLLTPHPSKRLGSQAGGSLDVQEHEWFQDTDFLALGELRAKTPFVPILMNRSDFGHFPNGEKIK